MSWRRHFCNAWILHIFHSIVLLCFHVFGVLLVFPEVTAWHRKRDKLKVFRQGQTSVFRSYLQGFTALLNLSLYIVDQSKTWFAFSSNLVPRFPYIHTSNRSSQLVQTLIVRGRFFHLFLFWLKLGKLKDLDVFIIIIADGGSRSQDIVWKICILLIAVPREVTQAPLGTVNTALRNSVILRVCMGI